MMSVDNPELIGDKHPIQSENSAVEADSKAVTENTGLAENINTALPATEETTAQLAQITMPETVVESVMPSLANTDVSDTSKPSVVQAQKAAFIYALGNLQVMFPNRGIKKEFLQAAMSLSVKEDDYYAVFTNNQSRTDPDKYLYLAEQVEWVLAIELKNTYLIRPVTEAVLQLLISAIQMPTDTLEPKYTCIIGSVFSEVDDAGLTEVAAEQVYSHTLEELHDIIQNNSSAQTQVIQNVIDELEYRPNKGASDFDRARNYIAYRYPTIYQHSNSMQSGSGDFSSASLVKIDFDRFDGVSQRNIIDVTFVYQENNSTIRICYFCRVDVTGMFPFMVSDLQRFTPLQAYQASRV